LTCVPYVASFSGLFFVDCPFGIHGIIVKPYLYDILPDDITINKTREIVYEVTNSGSVTTIAHFVLTKFLIDQVTK
jgi:hypothetical protein